MHFTSIQARGVNDFDLERKLFKFHMERQVIVHIITGDMMSFLRTSSIATIIKGNIVDLTT